MSTMEEEVTELVDASSKSISFIPTKSRSATLDFKRRQLIFDSFENLKDLRTFKRKRGIPPPKSSAGTLVYTWGAGFYGQLGRVGRGTDRCAKVPTQVEFDSTVVQVACGGFHSAALTEGGQVYTWGDGRMGQLGNLDKQHNVRPMPGIVDRLVSLSVNVISIACGQYHTAVLADDESIYTWGSGKYGQLGLGARFDERFPTKIDMDQELLAEHGGPIAISCGDRHTCIVTKKFRVLSFGGGEHGQLGHDNGEDIISPKMVQSLAAVRIVQVSCGATNTAAVSENGEVYVWGFGENLHPRDQPNIFYRPRQVRFKEKITAAACGQSHVMLLTDSRDVYCYGSGSEGQIGHGSTTNIRVPRLVLKGKNIYEIAAGRYHSMCLSAHGALYAWGCGESGQLGHNSVDNEMFPRIVDTLLGNVVGMIACGEHHTMALTSSFYSSVSQDVMFWKLLEDEELRLKKLMLRKNPSGLKTWEILRVEIARDKIRKKHEEKIELIGAEDATDIVKRLVGVKNAEDMTKLADGKWLLGQEEAASMQNRSKELGHKAPSSKQPKVKVSEKATSPATSVESLGEKNLFIKRPKKEMTSRPTVAAVIPRNQSVHDVAVSSGENDQFRKTGNKFPNSASVPDLHSKKSAQDGNPLVSRILFFEKASSALRLVKASLEKETPQYMVDNTNVEEVFRNRERLDKLRDEIRAKTTKLNALKSVYKFMKPAPEDLAMAAKREAHIKELNMKLLTLNTRQIEAEENKKNYELNILRMKDERLELSKKIESLRGLLSEHERLFQKVSAMSERVLAEKNSVDSEILKFKSDMEGFRSFFAFQLKSYHQILINKISNSREQERKVREKNNRSEQRKRERVERMKHECDQIIEEGHTYRQELQELVAKLEYYEERFHKIKLATGLSDPQDIIDKFYFNEEIDRELKEEISAHVSVISKLKVAKTMCLVTLDDQKNTAVDSKWKHVDQLQDQYKEITLKMVRRRNEVEQMDKKLAFVQEGLLSLTRAIDSAEGVSSELSNGSSNGKPHGSAQPGPNDSCLMVLAALQHRLGKLSISLGIQPNIGDEKSGYQLAMSGLEEEDEEQDGNTNMD